MSTRYLLLSFLVSLSATLKAQQIPSELSSQTAEDILIGNYNPAGYLAGSEATQANMIPAEINKEVSPDSLKSYLEKLVSFENRNTGNVSNSNGVGMGAAREWVLQKFNQFSGRVSGRLVPSYNDFQLTVCGTYHHKNILAVLPGTDTANHRVILIEGHMDSRCEGTCDTTCVARGAEDNGSGTALVIELARVMSKYRFKSTIVFMVTTGEEQGLIGAHAFKDYVEGHNIPLTAVLNNDVIGGIICGETSSPPSCPGLNDIDSTHTRIFSHGSFNSPSKQLARYTKLQYKEELHHIIGTRMELEIMTAEDRTGRGGDHIPFRQAGYPAIRFTAANEHGDAGHGPNYDDRQHTEDDILGVDTNGDNKIDSFFVDFTYLARNAIINGTSASQIANSPNPVEFTTTTIGKDRVEINITSSESHPAYRVAIRSDSHDWDSVYTVYNKETSIFLPDSNIYYFSVASMDWPGIESLFSEEKSAAVVSMKELTAHAGAKLLQNKPNPFDEMTIIPFWADEKVSGKEATIQILSLQGKPVNRHTMQIQPGLNEWRYHHGFGATGTYYYRLLIDGEYVDTKAMIFAY